MRKKRYLIIFVAAFTIIASCKKREKNIPVEVKELGTYPSASGIEYYNDRVYIVGDDANNLLILDSGLNTVDSISLYSFAEKRIPKTVKADLEAIAVLTSRKLLLLGSGSLFPYRNIAWLIDPATNQKDSIRLDTFYQRLQGGYVKELNIEGATAISGSFILSNRGNKSYRKNHLLFTDNNFWQHQSDAKIHAALIGFNTDTSAFSGVSGMCYSSRSDRLILTVSTEDTRNSLEDGTIGKSYLWVIKNISTKKRWKAINPDQIIDLEKTDAAFKGHKIESVCLLEEDKKYLKLVLAADNDNGSSSLFRLTVKKE